jgi:hypothetical protein
MEILNESFQITATANRFHRLFVGLRMASGKLLTFTGNSVFTIPRARSARATGSLSARLSAKATWTVESLADGR